MSTIKFTKSEKYPKPSDTFAFKLKSKEEVLKTCIFVLDANVLILPYTADAESLQEIRNVYSQLVKKDRIFIPAQAAREYLDNRSTKLSDAHELLQKKQNQNFQFIKSHPLLNELKEFKELLEIETKLRESLKQYSKQISTTLDIIKSWGWDDPVSQMYHEVLPNSVLDDSHIERDEIRKDLERRHELKIPPGYKDASKDANQAGDLIIWHEILSLAKQKQEHVVFVSGDEKADWWHQSGGKALYPRFELVEEFRSKSGGKSFHIVSLSELLKSFNVKADVVEAVEAVEATTENMDRKLFKDLVHPELLNIIDTSRKIIYKLRLEIDYYKRTSRELENQRRHESNDDDSISPAVWKKYQRDTEDLGERLLAAFDDYRLDLLHFLGAIEKYNPKIHTRKKEYLFWSAREPDDIIEAVNEFERLVNEASPLNYKYFN